LQFRRDPLVICAPKAVKIRAMSEDRILKRIDRSIDRIEKHVEATREHIARGNDAFGRMMDVMAEVKFELVKNREERETLREERATMRDERQDLKFFIRDITRRTEVVHREIVGELADLRTETQANTREILSRLPPAA